MWWLYVLGGLVALLTALLVSDVVLHITFDGRSFVLTAEIWWFKYGIYPQEQTRSKKKKDSAKKKTEKPKKKSDLGLGDIRELIDRIVKIAGNTISVQYSHKRRRGRRGQDGNNIRRLLRRTRGPATADNEFSGAFKM